ncbi:MAG: META domain-containing protein [Ignavibacteria bacterium]
MKNTTTVIFCLFIFISLSCNSSKSVNNINDLTSKQWNLNTLYGKIPEAKSPDYKNPYIGLTPNNGFSGFTGCNSFTGTYKYESGKLTLDPGAITKIYCGDGIEIEFLDAIKKVTGYEIKNNNLELLKGGDVIMTFISK